METVAIAILVTLMVFVGVSVIFAFSILLASAGKRKP